MILRYPLRNLWRRGARTVVTALGIAATALLVMVMTAFTAGVQSAAGASARDDVVVLLGTSAEVDLVRSVVPRGSAEAAAAAAPGVADDGGVRAASVELHLATRTGDRIGLLRGVTPAAYAVHRQVTLVEGREPRQAFELMVGRLAATRMGLPEEELAVGRTIHLEHRDWTITGRFAAPGTVSEAELWGRLDDLMVATRRSDVSCVVLRLEDPALVAEVSLFAARRLDLEIAAVPERELLRQLEQGLAPIVTLARWMSLLAVVAGAFACANTMFAAALARTRELATLRALGQPAPVLALALVLEAALIAFLGGGLGCLCAAAIGDLPLRFPMGALKLELAAGSRALGLAAALVSGVLGGLVPAIRAVRIPMIEALGGRA